MAEHIGQKIKQLREASQITPDTAAEAAHLPVSQLELIESGDLVPSISTLIKIARALGVRLGTILDGEEHPGPVVSSGNAIPTVSISSENAAARTHLDFFSLAKDKTDRNMEPYMVNVAYRKCSDDQRSSHEGEEFLYVVDGTAELRYGNQTYTLRTGDSIYYDSIVPHCLSTAAEGETARVLAVTYTPC
ncbi:MAG: helix-turn-helix transcriptional regulator [Rikenellaceae bacterium]|nr:helix-turn-helix transcriptional regulator [Rikenellaceae bacterium]